MINFFFKKYIEYLIKKETLILSSIETTTDCNLKCKFCKFWKEPKKYPNTRRIKHEIDEVSEAGTLIVDIFGGEPLLREDIVEITKYAKLKVPLVFMSTNGVLLTRSLIQKLRESCLDHLSVSVDGREETHEKLRGKKGIFKKVIKNLKLLSEFGGGMSISINSVITKENFHEMEWLSEFSRKFGFSHQFIPVQLNLKGAYISSKCLVGEECLKLDKKDLKLFSERVIELKKKHDHVMNTKSFLKSLTKKRKNCVVPRTGIRVDVDGNVFQCHFGLKRIGNLFEDHLGDILKSERARKNRERLSNCDACRIHSFHEINVLSNPIRVLKEVVLNKSWRKMVF